jgi:hypothetical protein
MGAKYIVVFGDSPMVVQKMKGEFQYFDGLLNNYVDQCFDLYIRLLSTIYLEKEI